MSNPMNLISLLQGNPQQFIQNALSNNAIMSNPMAKNALELYQNGDVEGMKSMAENLCKERNTTVDEVKNSLISQFGLNK